MLPHSAALRQPPSCLQLVIMRAALALLALVATAHPAVAQSEDRLRAFFEGKTVRLKMEMPGTEDGVDVYPGTAHPIDFPKHATRLKRAGTALRRGDEVLVTKVKVKRDLIEFQLGGGGYGTFGDDDSPNVFVPSASKTEREKNLEKDLEKTTDPTQRRKMREELDALRRDRQREDARNQAEAAQAQQTKEANIRQRRLEGGSRFNVRYKPVVPPEALTPDGLMQALAEYLDFSSLAGESAPGPAPRAAPAPGPDGLRKGLTADEVDALLGRPDAIARRTEGSLTVSTSTYRTRDRAITAEFVEGVLVRFTITSP
jgi:hypothetical protein